jgi:toxin-antitoxin system PIN domain toxin
VILPDVNVLVYAYRREAAEHDAYAAWISSVVGGSDELALVDHCLAGVVRIVTNPRIVADPAPTAHALAFVDRLRTATRARVVAATAATWSVLGDLARDDPGVRGNLVPDAYLAALAISHGCRLATRDRGFARFPRLDHFDPAA